MKSLFCKRAEVTAKRLSNQISVERARLIQLMNYNYGS